MEKIKETLKKHPALYAVIGIIIGVMVTILIIIILNTLDYKEKNSSNSKNPEVETKTNKKASIEDDKDQSPLEENTNITTPETNDSIKNNNEVSTNKDETIINYLNEQTEREIGYIIITGGITTMQGFNTIVEELFVRNATVMNLGIIGIRNNKYACSYGVIKYFVEKLDLREKKYTMYGDEKIEEIMSTRKKIGATGVLGKVFDKIFD